MEPIELVRPDKTHETAAADYIREHVEHGETALPGAALLEKFSSYDEWLDRLKANSDEKNCSSGMRGGHHFFRYSKKRWEDHRYDRHSASIE